MKTCQIVLESSYIGDPNRKVTELIIDDGHQIILDQPSHPRQPGDDIVISFSTPGVAQRWEELKGWIQGFAEFVLANGTDNSSGACTERFFTEKLSSSESFQINASIGPEGNEEPAELYIDGDARIILVLPERGLGKPGSDTVAFLSDPPGSEETQSPATACPTSELARRWEELKGRIKRFAGFLAAMGNQKEAAPA